MPCCPHPAGSASASATSSRTLSSASDGAFERGPSGRPCRGSRRRVRCGRGDSPQRPRGVAADDGRGVALERVRQRRHRLCVGAVAERDADIAREALAIFHEHRSRDLGQARSLVLDVLSDDLEGRRREDAVYRLQRIERKLSVREQGGLIAALEATLSSGD